MFKSKYKVSFLNSKWEPMTIKLNLTVIPRRDEYVYVNEQYYQVLNVVHKLNEKQDIFIVLVEAFPTEGE